MHDCILFKPILVEDLLTIERKQPMENLIFLTEKRDGKIKVNPYKNGSTQQNYTNCNKAASPTSPTAMSELHLIPVVIDAKQGRDIMTANIPNACIQTLHKKQNNNKQTIMKIRGLYRSNQERRN